MADLPAIHVLVIDDDDDTRANLRDILELDDYRVDTAGSAADALNRGNWGEYAAIVVDRRLPDGNAEELLPRFKELAPQAAVIVVTGYADLQGAIAAMREGAADYILKPIKSEELRARLSNIAERIRAAAALREAQQRVLQAERLATIGQTIATLAHESRNALQRIQVAVENLTNDLHERPASLRYVAAIQEAQEHLHHLYERLRRFAAPVVLHREPSHLADILREAWFHLQKLRQGRDIQWIEHGDDIDLDCSVDWFAVGQVFRNILENALAACQDPVRIDVFWSENVIEGRPAVRVGIRDNGPGLTPEQQRKIFEPFFTTKSQGTGLGMAIARNLIEAHGGRIAAGGSPGRGTEIVVVLPRDAHEGDFR